MSSTKKTNNTDNNNNNSNFGGGGLRDMLTGGSLKPTFTKGEKMTRTQPPRKCHSKYASIVGDGVDDKDSDLEDQKSSAGIIDEEQMANNNNNNHSFSPVGNVLSLPSLTMMDHRKNHARFLRAQHTQGIIRRAKMRARSKPGIFGATFNTSCELVAAQAGTSINSCSADPPRAPLESKRPSSDAGLVESSLLRSSSAIFGLANPQPLANDIAVRGITELPPPSCVLPPNKLAVIRAQVARRATSQQRSSVDASQDILCCSRVPLYAVPAAYAKAMADPVTTRAAFKAPESTIAIFSIYIIFLFFITGHCTHQLSRKCSAFHYSAHCSDNGHGPISCPKRPLSSKNWNRGRGRGWRTPFWTMIQALDVAEKNPEEVEARAVLMHND